MAGMPGTEREYVRMRLKQRLDASEWQAQNVPPAEMMVTSTALPKKKRGRPSNKERAAEGKRSTKAVVDAAVLSAMGAKGEESYEEPEGKQEEEEETDCLAHLFSAPASGEQEEEEGLLTQAHTTDWSLLSPTGSMQEERMEASGLLLKDFDF